MNQKTSLATGHRQYTGRGATFVVITDNDILLLDTGLGFSNDQAYCKFIRTSWTMASILRKSQKC